MDEMTLSLLAHLSAHRRLLINLYTLSFMAEPEPVEAAELQRKKFADVADAGTGTRQRARPGDVRHAGGDDRRGDRRPP